jgi:hypothetical protein
MTIPGRPAPPARRAADPARAGASDRRAAPLYLDFWGAAYRVFLDRNAAHVYRRVPLSRRGGPAN